MNEFEMNVTSTDPLELITTYYRNEANVDSICNKHVTINPRPFVDEEYESNHLEHKVQRLVSTVQELDKFLSGAYLHGSFADGKYVRNYSDLDLLFILNTDTATNVQKIENLHEKLKTLIPHYYFIDPHQHHGPVVIAEQDLNTYNRVYLPPVALSQGCSLFECDPLTFRIREDELERINGFWRVLQTLRRTTIDEEFPSRFGGDFLTARQTGPLYCLKHFTSLVMLLPSLYATAIGYPVYKAQSFSLPILSKIDEYGILDRCTNVRSAYPEVVSFDRSRRYRAMLESDPELARRNMQNLEVPERLWQLLGKDYFEHALYLAEQLWIRI